MSTKRSRIPSSPSLNKLSHMADLSSTAVKPRKYLKLHLPLSPVRETNSDGIADFLKNCYYCKKKINQNDEVFMYSDLRAFCTDDCRDCQIAMDNKMEKQAAASEAVALAPRVNNVQG